MEMTNKYSNTLDQGQKVDSLLIAGMVGFTGLNVAYDMFGLPDGIWYIGNAFAFCCYSLALLIIRRNLITKILMLLTGAQMLEEVYWFFREGSEPRLLDMLFGQPTVFNVWEYAIFIVIIWWIVKAVVWK